MPHHPPRPNHRELLDLFRARGQEHVFAGWDALTETEREELAADCATIDFDWIQARWAEAGAAVSEGAAARPIQPAPVASPPRTGEEQAAFREATRLGEETLRQGKVAAFLVAGGQGTRLGFDGPKGCYPIGPVSGRTLFQWHAEQILARGRRHGAAIPWYIMTSRDNDADTKAFFEAHGHFGLRREDVFFFTQEMVPCLDFSGKLMLASPSRLAMNPNGHGGSLSGLVRSGAADDMKRRGIEIITYFQVDNPLATIADPAFLGWHVKSGSEMSCKVLEKNAPDEPIGVVCLRDGRPAVVEYTDLDPASMRAKGPDGRLLFWAGSIAIHMINVDFARNAGAAGGLPWHRNRKKVPYFDGERVVRPAAENALKFETFVFDALPHAKTSLNFEVKREQEFAPVKNAAGKDSVASCRRLLSEYFGEWLAARGVTPSGTAGPDGPMIEISPLYSLDREELARKVTPGGVRLEQTLLLG